MFKISLVFKPKPLRVKIQKYILTGWVNLVGCGVQAQKAFLQLGAAGSDHRSRIGMAVMGHCA